MAYGNRPEPKYIRPPVAPPVASLNPVDALLRQNARLEETIRALSMALDQAATLVGDLTKQRPALDRRHILGELISLKNEIMALRKLVADGKPS